MSSICLRGAIVLVAKCPIAGKSKTRLSKLVGKEGSALLAKSMLSDVLESIGQCVRILFLFYVSFLHCIWNGMEWNV